MSDFTDKNAKILVILLNIIISVVFAYFFFSKLLWWLLPFILAYLISLVAEPLVKLMKKYLKLPRKFSSVIAILLVFSIISGIITLIIIKLINELQSLVIFLPYYKDLLFKKVYEIQNTWNLFYQNLSPDIVEYLDEGLMSLIKGVTQTATSWINSSLKTAGTITASIPKAIVFIIAMLLSSYFFTSDKEKIRKIAVEYLPDKYRLALLRIKNILTGAIGSYIKAQSILLLITFIELTIGFAIIKVDYSLILSIGIALIDALPVFGVGTVLIPWALVSFLAGNIKLGVSLLLLYGIIWLVRQLIEPRIVSVNLGLHPILTLLTVYIGINTMGFIGMILFPIVTILIINFLKIYIKKTKETTTS